MNKEYLKSNFEAIECELTQQKVLTFVVTKNVIKIQIFIRAILRMRNEASTKIKRKLKFIKQQRDQSMNKN